MAKNKKPVPTEVRRGQMPVVASSTRKARWSFNFENFRQINDFGFAATDVNWFASLFARLSDSSKIELDRLMSDNKMKQDLRYHPIDWNAKGISIARKDLDWIHRDIIDNEEEFVFYQVHISKAASFEKACSGL